MTATQKKERQRENWKRWYEEHREERKAYVKAYRRGSVQSNETKCCTKCNATKPIRAFARNRNIPGGFGHSCKDCKSNYAKQRRLAQIAAYCSTLPSGSMSVSGSMGGRTRKPRSDIK